MMKAFVKLPHQDFFSQLIRFGITGSLATLVHFTVVVLFVELLHITPLAANIVGFFSGFIISFSGHRFWTFATTSRTTTASLPRFFIIAAFNFAANQTLYFLLLKKLHLQYAIALVLVLAFMAITTYCLGRWWAFR